MAKKEVRTDLWVAKQLDDCRIRFDAQGSNVKEIDEALKSASKRGTGKAGSLNTLLSLAISCLSSKTKPTLTSRLN